MKEWIRVCDSTHQFCRRDGSVHHSKTAQRPPTRLIEIHPGSMRLNLVETADRDGAMGTEYLYVALSYCWGKLTEGEKLCTYADNYALFKKEIPQERLPRTIRDAVAVTVGLGLRYLWIDSLCIIQDDDGGADWKSESKKMEHIFSNAFVTIAASAARSSVEGFLKTRPPRPCVQIPLADTTPHTRGTLYVCPFIDDFSDDVEGSELCTRGWVLQERVLSRRTIFFGKKQMYWECGQGVQCETLGRLHKYVFDPARSIPTPVWMAEDFV